jgi:ATP-dependent DNA ligase
MGRWWPSRAAAAASPGCSGACSSPIPTRPALLLGHHQGGDLVYAGKVGTGFDDELLERLRRRLTSLEQDRPPFSVGRLPRAEVHWVRPELVAQIGFSEWTGDGQLRHPRFLGLRDDKRPHVVRERPR